MRLGRFGRDALAVAVVLSVCGCAKDLSELSPYPCATDNSCPEGFACVADRGCVKVEKLFEYTPFPCIEGTCPDTYQCVSKDGRRVCIPLDGRNDFLPVDCEGDVCPAAFEKATCVHLTDKRPLCVGPDQVLSYTPYPSFADGSCHGPDVHFVRKGKVSGCYAASELGGLAPFDCSTDGKCPTDQLMCIPKVGCVAPGDLAKFAPFACGAKDTCPTGFNCIPNSGCVPSVSCDPVNPQCKDSRFPRCRFIPSENSFRCVPQATPIATNSCTANQNTVNDIDDCGGKQHCFTTENKQTLPSDSDAGVSPDAGRGAETGTGDVAYSGAVFTGQCASYCTNSTQGACSSTQVCGANAFADIEDVGLCYEKCNLAKDTCAEKAGCELRVVVGQNRLEAACKLAAGKIPEGGICSLNVNCVAGAICLGFDDNFEGHCIRVCDTDNASKLCGTNGTCLKSWGTDTQYGECRCTLGTACTARPDETCRPLMVADATGSKSWVGNVCTPDGKGSLNAACGADSDCGAGLRCKDARCRMLCSSNSCSTGACIVETTQNGMSWGHCP